MRCRYLQIAAVIEFMQLCRSNAAQKFAYRYVAKIRQKNDSKSSNSIDGKASMYVNCHFQRRELKFHRRNFLHLLLYSQMCDAPLRRRIFW